MNIKFQNSHQIRHFNIIISHFSMYTITKKCKNKATYMATYTKYKRKSIKPKEVIK
jgi:hypothetical protein